MFVAQKTAYRSVNNLYICIYLYICISQGYVFSEPLLFRTKSVHVIILSRSLKKWSAYRSIL